MIDESFVRRLVWTIKIQQLLYQEGEGCVQDRIGTTVANIFKMITPPEPGRQGKAETSSKG
jgi:hypothetical protein